MSDYAAASADAFPAGRRDTPSAAPVELHSPQDALRLPNVERWTRLMLSLAPHTSRGSITIGLPDGRRVLARGKLPGPNTEITLRNNRFPKRMLFGGNLGVGQSFMDGDFDCDDIGALAHWACINTELDNTLMGKPWLRLLRRLAFAFNNNTKRGSRRNIAYHYDLGNEFYSQWLDPSMTYSSAIYEHEGQALEQAQQVKYRRLAGDVLRLKPGETVLEIGCGWGGFAEVAAKEFGALIHGITISREQHDFASRRVFEAGLADKVKIELRDYRDTIGKYDAVASIEMIEAVGEKFWPTYFSTLRGRLKPEGRAGLQAIVIQDEYFEAYRGTMDFIQAFIFPGGMLPAPMVLDQQAALAGLRIAQSDGFALDYARTLREWTERFQVAWPQLRALGFDERFRRMWLYYLGSCEGGFRANCIDVLQLRLDPT
jgi:cyclopropane-fatty-acyl-phospholipid synthase